MHTTCDQKIIKMVIDVTLEIGHSRMFLQQVLKDHV